VLLSQSLVYPGTKPSITPVAPKIVQKDREGAVSRAPISYPANALRGDKKEAILVGIRIGSRPKSENSQKFVRAQISLC
jgi:hypothetical protein